MQVRCAGGDVGGAFSLPVVVDLPEAPAFPAVTAGFFPPPPAAAGLGLSFAVTAVVARSVAATPFVGDAGGGVSTGTTTTGTTGATVGTAAATTEETAAEALGAVAAVEPALDPNNR